MEKTDFLRCPDARAAISEALEYADAIDAGSIRVMAGFAQGPEARAAFIENLQYGCDQAPKHIILIEPLNRHDALGYFLRRRSKLKRSFPRLDAGTFN